MPSLASNSLTSMGSTLNLLLASRRYFKVTRPPGPAPITATRIFGSVQWANIELEKSEPMADYQSAMLQKNVRLVSWKDCLSLRNFPKEQRSSMVGNNAV